ncbi:hypothetical protein D9M68_999150 [compost metagenome]
MVASAHSRQDIASKRVRDTRSAKRPAGRASKAYTAAKASPEIKPMAVSLTPNSCLMGSIITARICRPTKLSANIIASKNNRP